MRRRRADAFSVSHSLDGRARRAARGTSALLALVLSLATGCYRIGWNVGPDAAPPPQASGEGVPPLLEGKEEAFAPGGAAGGLVAPVPGPAAGRAGGGVAGGQHRSAGGDGQPGALAGGDRGGQGPSLASAGSAGGRGAGAPLGCSAGPGSVLPQRHGLRRRSGPRPTQFDLFGGRAAPWKRPRPTRRQSRRRWH